MYEIVQAGHPALRKKAEPLSIEDIKTLRIQNLITEMKSLLAKEDLGVALAAPQVGEALRIFIVSGRTFMEHDEDGKPVGPPVSDMVYINPEISRMSRSRRGLHEGCLSVRGKWGIVPRAEKATIKALDENGVPFTRNASGLLAHIFQHEMDHLEGVLYTDSATDVYDDDRVKEQVA